MKLPDGMTLTLEGDTHARAEMHYATQDIDEAHRLAERDFPQMHSAVTGLASDIQPRHYVLLDAGWCVVQQMTASAALVAMLTPPAPKPTEAA